MTQAPRLTDRAALMRNRARASGDLFLHRAAVDEAQDRLAMVNRQFTDIAVVTGQPGLWTKAFPGARIVGDDDVLTLGPEAHDLVIHAMCLHWADDPVGQLVQCRRALRPDGLCLSILPGGETLSDLRMALSRAEIEVTGGLSPRVLPMADLRDLGALLQRAGLALPVADVQPITAEYRDLRHLMHDLRAMGEGNAMTDRLRHATRRAVFDRADAICRDMQERPAGPLLARFDLVTLTGWAPAASQPKALRPGSAQARLAQALGTTETPLSD